MDLSTHDLSTFSEPAPPGQEAGLALSCLTGVRPRWGCWMYGGRPHTGWTQILSECGFLLLLTPLYFH